MDASYCCQSVISAYCFVFLMDLSSCFYVFPGDLFFLQCWLCICSLQATNECRPNVKGISTSSSVRCHRKVLVLRWRLLEWRLSLVIIIQAMLFSSLFGRLILWSHETNGTSYSLGVGIVGSLIGLYYPKPESNFLALDLGFFVFWDTFFVFWDTYRGRRW